MSSRLVIYRANDQLLTLPGVKNLSGTLITGAQITATLVNKKDEVVSDAFDHLEMEDVDGSPGKYRCLISSDFNPALGSYQVIYECLSPSVFHVRQPASVKDRFVP